MREIRAFGLGDDSFRAWLSQRVENVCGSEMTGLTPMTRGMPIDPNPRIRPLALPTRGPLLEPPVGVDHHDKARRPEET